MNYDNIDHHRFPEQGKLLGMPVKVTFHNNIQEIADGEVVRNDVEDPYRTIIKMADGRYVMANECQFTIHY